MIHGGDLYVGDLLNQTYQSYDEMTGQLRWKTTLQSSRDLPGTVHQPRGGAVYWDGKIIEAEGLHIWTLDPTTGQILNDFIDPGYFGVWGIATPVIVGDEMYLGAISGWVFAVPAQYVTTNPGPGPGIGPTAALGQEGNYSVAASAVVPPNPPCYYNPAALPTPAQAAGFPSQWLAYAGGPDHNAVVADSASGPQYSWQTPLADALPLSSPARDAGIFGAEPATEMTSLAFGAGTGITPVNGIVYVGSDRYTVNALNAATGQLIWSFCTINADYGQPLVTPHTVIVSSGDPWFNFASVTTIAKGGHSHLGASLQNLHGLDPLTGMEKWTFYTKGTDMMTPRYYGGNIYWVNGNGNVWGINADTGKTFAPFEDSSGNPTLNIGGFNAIDSANIVTSSAGPLMLVGTADPAAFYAINLNTDTVAWKLSTLPSGMTPYFTGFAASSPVVDQHDGSVITSVLVNASSANDTVTDEAIALDATTGAVLWTRALGSGPIPYGYTAATPLLADGQVIFADPVSRAEVALDARSGALRWSTPLGQQTKAPGVALDGKVIQPAGPDIFTLDEGNGAIVHTLNVGGYFKDNGPLVVGRTLYVGNSWGWAMAFPLDSLGVGGPQGHRTGSR